MKHFQKDRPKEYKRLANVIIKADMNKINYTPESLKKLGLSTRAVRVWQSYRTMMNNAFDQLYAEMANIIKEHEKPDCHYRKL